MKAEYIDHMGSDLAVVNAARVSFDKESQWEGIEHRCSPEDDICNSRLKLSEKDAKLISYLAKNGHWSPFTHGIIKTRITVPIFVANQLKRHQVGFALNEVSRRYVDDEPEFYYPEEWRGRPPGSIKQGSGEEVIRNIFYKNNQLWATGMVYKNVVETAKHCYTEMIKAGVAPEMARMVLPQSMYTSWIWTASVAAYARLCKQRLDPHAQQECREVAQQIADIVKPLFPVSWAALVEGA